MADLELVHPAHATAMLSVTNVATPLLGPEPIELSAALTHVARDVRFGAPFSAPRMSEVGANRTHGSARATSANGTKRKGWRHRRQLRNLVNGAGSVMPRNAASCANGFSPALSSTIEELGCPITGPVA